MIADAEARGLSKDSVDSVYLKGEAAILEHEKRNGYDKEYGPHGIVEKPGTGLDHIIPKGRQIFI